MKKLKRIILAFVICLVGMHTVIFAEAEEATDNSQILKEQQEELGIADFISASKKYTQDNLDDVDVKDIFSSAITGRVGNTNLLNNLLNILGREFKTTVSSIRHYLDDYHYT